MEAPVTQTSWVLFTVFIGGILAGDWSVKLPSAPICAMIGSTVVLPCSYNVPRSRDRQRYEVTSEMWCLGERRCITERYVYHSAGIFPEPSFQSRVEYLGKLGSKNCSVKISDLRESDSGMYVFYVITNHTSEKMPAQRGLQLLVAGSPSVVTVLASPSGDITEGESVSLSCCSPEDIPDVQFGWYKSSSPTSRHVGPVWTIGNVKSEDSDRYHCEVQAKGGVRKSKELALDVQYSPRHTVVSVLPVDREAGGPVTLTCSSDANPPILAYTWYEDAACDPAADTSFHKAVQSYAATTTRKGQTLSNISISSDDSKVHCCVARNRHGSQTSSVTLDWSSESSGGRMVLLGVTIAVLLCIIAVVAFVMSRRKKSSSYALTQTTASEP